MIACVVFYNDAELLDRCLKSLSSKVDNIIAIDGAYKDFPHDKPYSTDGSIDVARKYTDNVITVNKAWETQVDKRNRYVQEIPVGESFIVIDTDEVLVADKLPEGNWKVKIKAMKEGGIDYYWERIFKKTPGWQYYKTHMTYKDDNGIIKPHFPIAEGVVIEHYLDDRDEERKRLKEIYRKKHNEREMKWRKKLR